MDEEKKPTIDETFEMFKKLGVKHIQKTGSIIMPVSKKQADRIKKSFGDKG